MVLLVRKRSFLPPNQFRNTKIDRIHPPPPGQYGWSNYVPRAWFSSSNEIRQRTVETQGICCDLSTTCRKSPYEYGHAIMTVIPMFSHARQKNPLLTQKRRTKLGRAPKIEPDLGHNNNHALLLLLDPWCVLIG